MSADTADDDPDPPSVPARRTGQNPGKVMRIAAMVNQLHQQAQTEPLDAATRNRLRDIHAHTISELADGLSPELPCVSG